MVFISFRINIACNELRKTGESEAEKADLSIPASYTGVLPCASCPGIRYALILGDENFTEASWYIDRDPEPFVTEGIWETSGDTLRLFDDDRNRIKTFLVEGRHLILLDQSDNRITGQLEDHYKLEPVSDYHSIAEHHERLKNQGVEFIASGNEPFWSVQIHTNNSITFTTPENTLFSDTFVEADVVDLSDGNEVKIYYYQVESAEIILQIDPVYCQDTMSGFLFTHVVQVSYDDINYEGCGSFISE